MPSLLVTDHPLSHPGRSTAEAPPGVGPQLGEVVPLAADGVVFGRSPGDMAYHRPAALAVHLPCSAVNRQHVVVRRQGKDRVVEDLDSRNGVLVNGERVGRAVLRDGDEVRVTWYAFAYRADPA